MVSECDPNNSKPASPHAVGSINELVSLFLDPAERAVWDVSHALGQKLLGISALSATAAEAQLAWWHDEINRAATGQPRHPLTQGLQPFIPDDRDIWPWLEQFLIHARSVLNGQLAQNPGELRVQLFRQFAIPLYVVYETLRHPEQASAPDCRCLKKLGIAHGLSELAESCLADPPASEAMRQLLSHPESGSKSDTTVPAVSLLANSALNELKSEEPEMTGIASIDMLWRLTELRLRKLSLGRKPGRLRLLFAAWRSAREFRN